MEWKFHWRVPASPGRAVRRPLSAAGRPCLEGRRWGRRRSPPGGAAPDSRDSDRSGLWIRRRAASRPRSDRSATAGRRSESDTRYLPGCGAGGSRAPFRRRAPVDSTASRPGLCASGSLPPDRGVRPRPRRSDRRPAAPGRRPVRRRRGGCDTVMERKSRPRSGPGPSCGAGSRERSSRPARGRRNRGRVFSTDAGRPARSGRTGWLRLWLLAEPGR